MNATLSNIRRDTPLLIRLRQAALAGIFGPIIFGGVLTLLNMLQYDSLLELGRRVGDFHPDIDNAVSVHALGPYGLLMNLNFLVFGLLVMIFAYGLYHGIRAGRSRDRWAKAGPLLVGIFGFALVLLSSTMEFPPPTTLHGKIHFYAFFLLMLSLTPAHFVIWWQLRRDPRWRGYDWYSLATGVLWIGLMFSTPLHTLTPFLAPAWWGMAGRFHLIVGFGWVSVLGIGLWSLVRWPADEAPGGRS